MQVERTKRRARRAKREKPLPKWWGWEGKWGCLRKVQGDWIGQRR